jgi:hypothetical protein
MQGSYVAGNPKDCRIPRLKDKASSMHNGVDRNIIQTVSLESRSIFRHSWSFNSAITAWTHDVFNFFTAIWTIFDLRVCYYHDFILLLLLWYKALCVVRSRKSVSFSYWRVFYIYAAIKHTGIPPNLGLKTRVLCVIHYISLVTHQSKS